MDLFVHTNVAAVGAAEERYPQDPPAGPPCLASGFATGFVGLAAPGLAELVAEPAVVPAAGPTCAVAADCSSPPLLADQQRPPAKEINRILIFN